MFRIYRDIRFSKDKTPYKTHFGISFHRKKPNLRGGYYLHIAPQNSFIATGFWNPNPKDLLRIRKELELDGEELLEIINKNNFKNKKELPFVSVCTPTFNRRPFFSAIIKCFEWQDYPKDKIEWIIIDDGTDKIEDLVSHIPQVRYFSYEDQMTLGKKRNISNREAKGDIIVYMDDDDYYSPTRVSHAVHMLKLHPKALCAGGSKQLIYFKHIDQMYQLGPYNDNHGTAGTFAFRKELLNITSFQDNAALAEERHFLKNSQRINLT